MGSIPGEEPAAEWDDAILSRRVRDGRGQAAAQGVVDELLERDVEQFCTLREGIRDVVVDGDGDSHGDITASLVCGVKVLSRLPAVRERQS